MSNVKSNGLHMLLNCLEKVHEKPNGQYIARCPAHKDKTPSLAIREVSSGRVLLHCFAGCDPENILNAVGLTFSDLIPECSGNFKKERKPYFAGDILQILDNESCLVYFCAKEILEGGKLNESEFNRLLLAVSRIRQARSMTNV